MQLRLSQATMHRKQIMQVQSVLVASRRQQRITLPRSSRAVSQSQQMVQVPQMKEAVTELSSAMAAIFVVLMQRPTVLNHAMQG
jgi:hypothetical protein